MKILVIFIIGLIGLTCAAIYGFAAALDYSKILRLCLAYDAVALVCFSILIQDARLSVRSAAIVFLVLALGVGAQALWRLF